MKGNLQAALDVTETTYDNLVSIANSIVKEHVAEVDDLVGTAYDDIDNLSNESIRNLILKLSLKTFSFGDIKEKSALKAECAEALRKEAYAIAFNGAEGSVAAKENAATINISDEILAETIYGVVANIFKTKLDECHRVISALTTVLTSRMAEAKLTAKMYEGEGNG